MKKVLVCVLILGLASVFAKTEVDTLVLTKCDTIKVVRTIDSTVTVKVKYDTLKTKIVKDSVKVEKKTVAKLVAKTVVKK